jgi:hypothetical protein
MNSIQPRPCRANSELAFNCPGICIPELYDHQSDTVHPGDSPQKAAKGGFDLVRF